MKKLIVIILILTANLQLVYAQSYKSASGLQLTIEESDNAIMQILDDFGFNNATPTNLPSNNNSVYISQIGNSNETIANVNADASDINVLQKGDFNKINLDYNVQTAQANLKQNGNFNKIVDQISLPTSNSSLNLNQNGSNLSFERFQTNKITESLQFNQNGNSKTLIIRSFK